MGWPSDPFATIFLICFFVGLIYTVAALLLGLGHEAGAGHHNAPTGMAGGHAHHGGGHGLGGHDSGGHSVGGHGAGGHGVSGHNAGGHGAGGQAGHGSAEAVARGSESGSMHNKSGPSPFNLTTAMAFLTWFGGAGYILRTSLGLWALVALVGAVLAGTIGAGLVFLFLSRILYASQRILDPRDFHLPGTLARVTIPIRPGGTGEIVYTKDGTRQVAGARASNEQTIERGTEVVIMRYERGLAYVERWTDLMQNDGETADLSKRVTEPPP